MNILLIDDHPMVIQSYINCLTGHTLPNSVPKFTVAMNCKDAFALIDNMKPNHQFDLALIDHRLPVYNEKSMLNGSDLALMLKEKNKQCKIVIITGHSEIMTVYTILKNVIPNGFMIKNDLTSESLVKGFQQVMSGTTYYSSRVKVILQEVFNKELLTDSTNREILFYLSKGYRIKELEGIVQLSSSSIKRRIAQMKVAFGISEGCSLVKEAILQGYL